MRGKLALLALLLPIVGCGTADSRLFLPGDPPRLRDGTVRMTTHWRPGQTDPKDVRVIRSRGGRITCSHISQAHGHFEGEAEASDWTRLWGRLLAARPFTTDGPAPDPPDPRGGPYHVIELNLADRRRSFSAQMRQNALIFTTKDVTERLGYANSIVSFTAEHATRHLEETTTRPVDGEQRTDPLP